MKHLNTTGIVLARTDFGEADRIVTFLTPDHGKLNGLVKGVRKSRSKLAGGIELFSISEFGFIVGRGEVRTITFTRLKSNFANVSAELPRAQAGFELLKTIHATTGGHPEAAYFELLAGALDALNNKSLPAELTLLWFYLRLLVIAGHQPDFFRLDDGAPLPPGQRFTFDYSKMRFSVATGGDFKQNDVKLLRLLSVNQAVVLPKLQVEEKLVSACLQLVRTIHRSLA